MKQGVPPGESVPSYKLYLEILSLHPILYLVNRGIVEILHYYWVFCLCSLSHLPEHFTITILVRWLVVYSYRYTHYSSMGFLFIEILDGLKEGGPIRRD